MTTFDKRHGGPFDRGSADFWYHHPRTPHYYVGATKTTPIVEESAMTPDEIAAYNAGYDGPVRIARKQRRRWPKRLGLR